MRLDNKSRYFGISLVLDLNNSYLIPQLKKVVDSTNIYYYKKSTYFHLLICRGEGSLDGFDIFEVLCQYLQKNFGDKMRVFAQIVTSECEWGDHLSSKRTDSHHLSSLILKANKHHLSSIKKVLPLISWGNLVVCSRIAVSGYCRKLQNITSVNQEKLYSATVSHDKYSFVGRESEIQQMRRLLALFLHEKCNDKLGLALHVKGMKGIGKTRLIHTFIENNTNFTSNGQMTSATFLGVAFQIIEFSVKEQAVFSGPSLHRRLMTSLFKLPFECLDCKFRTALLKSSIPVELHISVLHLANAELQENEKKIYNAISDTHKAEIEVSVIRTVISLLTKNAPLLFVLDNADYVNPIADQESFLAQIKILVDATTDQKLFLLITSRNDGISQNDPKWIESINTLELSPLISSQAETLVADIEQIESAVSTNKTFNNGFLGAKKADGHPRLILQRTLCTLMEQDMALVLQNEMKFVLQTCIPTESMAIKLAAVFDCPMNKERINSIREFSARLYQQSIKNNPFYKKYFSDCHGLLKRLGETYHFTHSLFRVSILRGLSKTEKICLNQYCAQWYRGVDLGAEIMFQVRSGDFSHIGSLVREANRQKEAFEFDRSLILVNDALKTTFEKKFNNFLYQALIIKAECLTAKYCTQEAIHIYEQVISDINNEEIIATCRIHLTELYFLIGAKSAMNECLCLGEEYGIKNRKWHALSEIYRQKARYLTTIGQVQEAKESFQKAIINSRKARSKLLEVKAKIGLAEVAHQKNDIVYASRQLQECMKVIEELGAMFLKAECLNLQTKIQIARLSTESAKHYACQAIIIAKATGKLNAELEARLLISDIFLDNLLLKHSENEIGPGLELAKKIDSVYYKALFLDRKSKLLHLEENKIEAKKTILEALDLMRNNYLDKIIGVNLYTTEALVIDENHKTEVALKNAEKLTQLENNAVTFYQKAIYISWLKKNTGMLLRYYHGLYELNARASSPKSEFYLAQGRLMIDMLNGIATVKELSDFNSKSITFYKRAAGLNIYPQ